MTDGGKYSYPYPRPSLTVDAVIVAAGGGGGKDSSSGASSAKLLLIQVRRGGAALALRAPGSAAKHAHLAGLWGSCQAEMQPQSTFGYSAVVGQAC